MELGYPRSEVPAGRSGAWLVEKFEIEDDGRSDSQESPVPDCARLRAGQYTRLRCGPTVFMTDLYDEWWTQRSAIDEARRRGGRVLITGLGLGLVIEAILRPGESRVDEVVVVERSPDVIRLVAPFLERRYGDQITVHEADAFHWQPGPGERFQVVWHDIWPNPWAPEAMEETVQLEARFGPFADWQGSWPRDYLAVYRSSA